MCPGTRKRTSGSEQRQSTQDTIWRTGPGLELGQTHAGMYCQVVKLWLWLNMVFLLNSAAVNSFCLRAMAMAGLFWLSAGLLFLLPHGLCKKVQVPQTRRQGDAKPLDPLEKLHSFKSQACRAFQSCLLRRHLTQTKTLWQKACGEVAVRD